MPMVNGTILLEMINGILYINIQDKVRAYYLSLSVSLDLVLLSVWFMNMRAHMSPVTLPL